jgi:HEAT repeat protein
MCVRTLSAILLSTLLAATANSQSVAKDSPKEIDKKDLKAWLTSATSDPDAAVREVSLMTIPNFPPVEVRKLCTKPLLKRIDSGGEPDPGVKLVVLDLIGSLGIEDAGDLKEALRLLNNYANGDFGSVARLHALQAIAKFGPKAHGLATGLANSGLVIKDGSFEVRRSAAQTLGQIGFTEKDGPIFAVQKALATNMVRDNCLPVRLEALQSLFIMGPAWGEVAKGAQKGAPPPIDDKAAQEIVDVIKKRLTGANRETNVQAELWCRLVIVRFGTQEDLPDQVNGIANHLKGPEDAVKYQSLIALRLLGGNAQPKIQDITNFVTSKETSPMVREAALMALGAIALGSLGEKQEKAIEPIIKVINDPNEEPEIRIAALKALAMMGEKAEKARTVVVLIINDDSNIKEPSDSKIALLHQALLTLAAMGIKAQPEIPILETLSKKLVEVKETRLKGPKYKEYLDNPETKRLLAKLTEKQKEELFKNHPEDQFKRFVDDAIEFIRKSTPGHPGGEAKKP